MTPASKVIAKLGGLASTAELLGRHEISVRKWNYPRSRGGSDGMVPGPLQSRILKLSRENGLGVTPEDFFAEIHVIPNDNIMAP